MHSSQSYLLFLASFRQKARLGPISSTWNQQIGRFWTVKRLNPVGCMNCVWRMFSNLVIRQECMSSCLMRKSSWWKMSDLEAFLTLQKYSDKERCLFSLLAFHLCHKEASFRVVHAFSFRIHLLTSLRYACSHFTFLFRNPTFYSSTGLLHASVL